MPSGGKSSQLEAFKGEGTNQLPCIYLENLMTSRDMTQHTPSLWVENAEFI